MTDIAWAAGFLEGEGNFNFTNRSPAGSGRISGTVHLSAAQKEREPLDKLLRILGGKEPRQYHGLGPNKDKDAWVWRMFGASAVGVMFTLYPHMSARRRQQIRRALAAWRQSPGNRYRCKGGHNLLETQRIKHGARGGSLAGCLVCSRQRGREYQAARRAAMRAAR